MTTTQEQQDEFRRQEILAELEKYAGKELPKDSELYKFVQGCADEMSEKLKTKISFSEIISDPEIGDNAAANGLGEIFISHQYADKYESLAELREMFQHELWHPQQLDEIPVIMYPVNAVASLIDYPFLAMGLYEQKNSLRACS